MKYFGAALALVAQLAQASLQTFYLEHGWQIQFDSDDCTLKVDKIVEGRGLSHVTVFEADKHLISIGKGDVDDYTIMTAGNIQRFPAR